MGSFFYDTPESAHKLLVSVIDAASRIREAAILAFHKGITVRWFEHDPTDPKGGLSRVLEPVNSREVFAMRQYGGSMVEYISLSVTNRESLVFWAPPTDKMPGVLFNADSDLADVNLKFSTENSLATAPHHGSESNANVYNIVEQNIPTGSSESVTWVRSDGQYSKRPGNAYLTKTGRRFCTLCRAGTASFPKPKQTVRLFTLKGRWVRHKDCAPCVCLPR